MKLLYSPASPYARKVRVLIIEKNLQDQVELVPVVPADKPDSLISANPLGRIPTLVRDDGSSLFDSPVICEFLDTLGDGTDGRSGTGDGQWAVKHLHAYGDGISDTVFTVSMERRRDASEQSPAYINSQVARVARGLSDLNHRVGDFALTPNLGEIAVACSLGYADLRLAKDLDWRAANPALAAWYGEICKRPSMAQTEPPK